MKAPNVEFRGDGQRQLFGIPLQWRVREMTFEEWFADTYRIDEDARHRFRNTHVEVLMRNAWEVATNEERKACAKLCEEVVTQPPGYGGQWEGYGPVTTTRDGKDCAATIRMRSNA